MKDERKVRQMTDLLNKYTDQANRMTLSVWIYVNVWLLCSQLRIQYYDYTVLLVYDCVDSEIDRNNSEKSQILQFFGLKFKFK